MGDAPGTEPGDYEALREANIQRNKRVLQSFGLEADKPTPRKRQRGAPRRPSKQLAGVEGVEVRRSSRLKGERPEYSKEKVDRFGEELDRAVELEERKPQRERVGERHKQLMEEAREAVLAERAKVKTQVKAEPGDQDAWKLQAVTRWGPQVENANPPSWQRFVESRRSKPPPLSPLGLMQEQYAHDPWKLLIACTLMSRVSSAEVKFRCIQGFFNNFPTPSAVMEHCTPEVALPIIDSLGLFDTRYRSIMDISSRFLVQDEFSCSRQGEDKIYGIGDFGVSSYEIWCLGEGKDLHPNDRNLAAFCNWLRAHAKAVGKNIEEEQGRDQKEKSPVSPAVPKPKAGKAGRKSPTNKRRQGEGKLNLEVRVKKEQE